MSVLIHDEAAPDLDGLKAWRDKPEGGPGYTDVWTYVDWLLASGRGKEKLKKAMEEVNFALRRELVAVVGGCGRFRFIPDTANIHFAPYVHQRSLPKKATCVGCGEVFQPKINGQKYCSTGCNSKVGNKRKSGRVT